MIKSKNYEEGTCEYVLAKFCEALKKKDWTMVTNFCCYSFGRAFHDPQGFVKKAFSEFKIKDISIWSYTPPTQVVFDTKLTVVLEESVKEPGKRAKTVLHTMIAELRLLKQDYKRCLAHEAGDWGVDPLSFKIIGVKEDIEKETEDV